MKKYTDYDSYKNYMEATYPDIFSGRYGGFCIDEGWWSIVDALCAEIQQHINWKNAQKDCQCEQVVVTQIKEKFGGLRFYYTGGDDTIDGMVRMSEVWALRTCEKCGAPGESIDRRGWYKTLCDLHANEEIQ